MTLEASTLLAVLRRSPEPVYARDLATALPGASPRPVAAILGALAARGWVRVTPGVGGSAARYEATRKERTP